jgi:hypothetical protein
MSPANLDTLAIGSQSKSFAQLILAITTLAFQPTDFVGFLSDVNPIG